MALEDDPWNSLVKLYNVSILEVVFAQNYYFLRWVVEIYPQCLVYIVDRILVCGAVFEIIQGVGWVVNLPGLIDHFRNIAVANIKLNSPQYFALLIINSNNLNLIEIHFFSGIVKPSVRMIPSEPHLESHFVFAFVFVPALYNFFVLNGQCMWDFDSIGWEFPLDIESNIPHAVEIFAFDCNLNKV